MARKTKDDALATRSHLLDAAEAVFYAKGVAGASLADVASAAGMTRGAIYWHFKDKLDLFQAMMARVTLPWEQALDVEASQLNASPCLARVLGVFDQVLKDTASNARVRRVFEIALFKMEHVGAMAPVWERRNLAAERTRVAVAQALQAWERQTGQSVFPSCEQAATGICSLLEGVLHAWLLRNGEGDLVAQGQAALNTFLRGAGVGQCL